MGYKFKRLDNFVDNFKNRFFNNSQMQSKKID